MTKDLEETLRELGPAYRPVVDRLLAARTAAPDGGRTPSVHVFRRRTVFIRRTAGLAAAAVLLAFGLAAVFRPADSRAAVRGPLVYTAAYAGSGSARAHLVATQRADGSWANDFLTRQNAAALAGATCPDERVAYKKALRYLRSKGLRPLSAAELKSRADAASRGGTA